MNYYTLSCIYKYVVAYYRPFYVALSLNLPFTLARDNDPILSFPQRWRVAWCRWRPVPATTHTWTQPSATLYVLLLGPAMTQPAPRSLTPWRPATTSSMFRWVTSQSPLQSGWSNPMCTPSILNLFTSFFGNGHGWYSFIYTTPFFGLHFNNEMITFKSNLFFTSPS